MIVADNTMNISALLVSFNYFLNVMLILSKTSESVCIMLQVVL